MGKIVASWVISPVMGGVLAALFLFVIKKTVLYRENMVSAARTFVPWPVAIMAWAFGTYLMVKGVKKVVEVDFMGASLVGLSIAVGGVFGVGFLREYLKSNYATQLHNIMDSHEEVERERLRRPVWRLSCSAHCGACCCNGSPALVVSCLFGPYYSRCGRCLPPQNCHTVRGLIHEFSRRKPSGKGN